jgi:hypothetical protein
MDRGWARAPDTVLDHAGRKEALGRVTGNENLFGAPQIPLGVALGMQMYLNMNRMEYFAVSAKLYESEGLFCFG